MRSGYININTGRLKVAGQNGYDWSSRASSTRWDGASVPSGYNLNFNATGVNPSNGPNERWHGFPLRCLCLRCGADLCLPIEIPDKMVKLAPLEWRIVIGDTFEFQDIINQFPICLVVAITTHLADS